MICRLAIRIPQSRRFSSSDRRVSKGNGQVNPSTAAARKKSTIDSVARRLATSPARCPPMPSATMNRRWSLRIAKLSSLWSRWSPTSLIPAAMARMRSFGGAGLCLPPRQQHTVSCQVSPVKQGAGGSVATLDREDLFFLGGDDLVHRGTGFGNDLFGFFSGAIHVVAARSAVLLDLAQ